MIKPAKVRLLVMHHGHFRLKQKLESETCYPNKKSGGVGRGDERRVEREESRRVDVGELLSEPRLKNISRGALYLPPHFHTFTREGHDL